VPENKKIFSKLRLFLSGYKSNKLAIAKKKTQSEILQY